jgi:hypothetical protein
MDSALTAGPYPEPLAPPADVLGRPPWSRRHPVAVDACVLIPDVLRRSRTDFSALTFVGEHKLAALVAPTHIDGKVREHLPQVAARTGCSVELAMHVWDTVHRPLIRFVDLAHEFPRDPRVAAVAQRDGEDGPLAHLAVLLAPSAVLTRDGDLTDAGIGQSDWLTTILVLKRLAELDAAVWGGSRFAWLCLYLPTLALASVGRRLVQSELALGATIGIAAGVVLFMGPQLRAAAESAWARVGPALERAMEAPVRGFELRAGADAALSSRLVALDSSATAEQAIARLLAEHWDPMPSVEIHAELVRRGHEMSLTATRAMLRERSALCPSPAVAFSSGAASARRPSPEDRPGGGRAGEHRHLRDVAVEGQAQLPL